VLVVVACLVYVSGLPWQQCVDAVLRYYEQISTVFAIAICCLIPFRVCIFQQKRINVEKPRFSMLGPLVSYISEPLYDAALFYSAFFMLHTVFQKELSLDPLLILLLVAVLLLYESLTDLFKSVRDIFYVQSMRNIEIK
jgi:hypothetical protein